MSNLIFELIFLYLDLVSDPYTCYYAASHGHLECLRYAHENDCEYDIEKCLVNGKKHPHIVEYLKSL